MSSQDFKQLKFLFLIFHLLFNQLYTNKKVVNYSYSAKIKAKKG